MNLVNNPADPSRFQITWIGHTTFLIQHAGLNILTDPMFGPRASPLPFGGPKRFISPGITLDQLPEINLVLQSHDHYDHLDLKSVKALGNTPHYVLPLRLSPWFQNRGITNTREYDWWDNSSFSGLRITCVPARHFSGRGLHDRKKTLWCGWVVESSAGKMFFAGDTGYGSLFRDIGDRLGPFDLSIIPIGAYAPRFYMQSIHCDPRQAVQIHQDVKSKVSIGSHWGTFKLTTEPMDEPPLLLAKSREDAGLKQAEFDVMAIGETRMV